MRLIAVAAVIAAGCVDPQVTVCEDGRLCPGSQVCDEIHDLCVLPAQLTACADLAEGALCPITPQVDGRCLDGVCVTRGCGDGVTEAAEQCDRAVLDGDDDCTDHGFHLEGAVTCTETCAFDTSACGPRCGDGVLDDDLEACDPGGDPAPDDDVLPDTTCLDFEFYEPDGIVCSPVCTLDLAACERHCGDGVLDAADGEECDEDALGAVDDCLDLGFYESGTVTCSGGCRYDTSACLGFCGDGIRDAGEACDPGATASLADDVLGGATCLDFGFYAPAGLACSGACTVVLAGCSTRCGDGVLDVSESCDDAGTADPSDDVFSGDCRDLGYYEPGGLACTAACTLDDAACQGECGDRVLDPEERCEGAPPPGESCLDFGFDDGALGCTALCTPDVSACRRAWSITSAEPSRFEDVILVDGVWYAVGDLLVVRSTDGRSWETFADRGDTLTSLWASSADDVFVTGFQAIHHWDGATWTSSPNPPGMALYGIGGTIDDLVAVGQGGTIMRWDGDTWTQDTSPTSSFLWAVWSPGPDDVFVVGNDGTVLHDDGTGWVDLDAPTAMSLNAVWASDPEDLFVGGDVGTILRWNGATWETMVTGDSQQVLDLWGRAADDVYASGDGVVLAWNGVRWRELEHGTTMRLAGVWGDADDVVTVGLAGRILRGTGQRWRPSLSDAAGPIAAVFGNPGADAAAVGGYGNAGVRTGPRWDFAHSGFNTAFYDVWSSGPGDFFIATWEAILRGDGITWTAMPGDPNPNAMAIWGLTANDAFAAGINQVHRWDGDVWSSTALTGYFLGVWAAGPDDAYAVGLGGEIVRWNGSGWASMASGTTVDLYGVWGSGPSDVFVVGDAGTILHGDGTTWEPMTSTTAAGLRGVHGVSATEVYAVGQVGTVLRWDGLAWSPMRSGTSFSVNSVWAEPGGDLVAVGDNSTIRELPRRCVGDSCDATPPTCAATPIACGATVTASTAGGASALDRYACDPWLELGRERVYELTPAASGAVTVSLTGLAADLDLIVLEGACTPTFPACLGASSTLGDEAVTFDAEAGVDYYLVVDGYGSSAGGFTLDVACP